MMVNNGSMTSTALRRYGPTGYLDNPQQLRWFSECVAIGLSAREITPILAISKKSAERYRNDVRVKAEALRLIEDRTIRVTSRVDTIIAARLDSEAEEISVETLLKIRREFSGRINQEPQENELTSDVVNDAMQHLEDSAELQELLRRQPAA
jgi:hypothetical protein